MKLSSVVSLLILSSGVSISAYSAKAPNLYDRLHSSPQLNANDQLYARNQSACKEIQVFHQGSNGETTVEQKITLHRDQVWRCIQQTRKDFAKTWALYQQNAYGQLEPRRLTNGQIGEEPRNQWSNVMCHHKEQNPNYEKLRNNRAIEVLQAEGDSNLYHVTCFGGDGSDSLSHLMGLKVRFSPRSANSNHCFDQNQMFEKIRAFYNTSNAQHNNYATIAYRVTRLQNECTNWFLGMKHEVTPTRGFEAYRKLTNEELNEAILRTGIKARGDKNRYEQENSPNPFSHIIEGSNTRTLRGTGSDCNSINGCMELNYRKRQRARPAGSGK